METKDLFAQYVFEGDYLDFTHDERAIARFPFGRDLQNLFIAYCGVFNEQAVRDGDPTRIHFGFVDSPVLGAWTYACADSQYVVVFAVGTYLRLAAFFNLLSLTASFNTVPAHDTPQKLSFIDVIGIGSDRDTSKIEHVPHLFPGDPRVEASLENLEYLLRLELPFVDDRHRFDATMLLECGLGYLFWHEVAHIVCGHLDADRSTAAARMAERPDSRSSDATASVTQGYELLADHYAALMLAINVPVFTYPPAAPSLEELVRFSKNQFSIAEAPAGESFVYRAAYAVLATLASFELTWSRLDAYAIASHPHPELRYAKMAASGLHLLNTEIRSTIIAPEEWSSMGDEPPSMVMSWHIGWSRARHDLELALGAWGLPNVLYWSNRTDISAFRAESKAAAVRLVAARERAASYGKRHLSLDSYWDDAYLRPMWQEVAGIDLPPGLVSAEEDDAADGNLIGVFEGEYASILPMEDALAKRFGADRVLALVHRDLRESDSVSGRTLLDIRKREEEIFFKQCAVVVGKCTGADGLAFLFAAYQALDRDWIRTLILVGPAQVLEFLDTSLRATGDERMQEFVAAGRLTVIEALQVDLVAKLSEAGGIA